MIDTSFLDSLARFNLIVRKRVTSSYSGPRKSVALGKGNVFSDHRIYAPGDDFRAIDWRVYARTDDLMIKKYEEERNLIVHVLVDNSNSMSFGTKFDFASMLGVGFAYLAMKSNDKFQFATFSDDVEVFQPKKGMGQLISMIDYLNKKKREGKTNISSVAEKYRKSIGSKALVILISDFLVPVEELKKALFYLGGNELNLIQVLDAKEKNLRYEGDFKLKDSETNDLMRTYISPKLREDYLERLENHSAKIEEECNNLGVEFSQVDTSMSIFDAFYRVLR
jgi:uncharacterized protein (DUF58 family)